MFGRARAVAAKSWPQPSQTVRPFRTISPQTGHARPFGRVMNQIRPKKTKPKKPINSTSATPIPVPVSQAFCWSWVWAWQPFSALLPPAIAQTTIRAHQAISTQVIFRQWGRILPMFAAPFQSLDAAAARPTHERIDRSLASACIQ
jgi:hypothetical protein